MRITIATTRCTPANSCHTKSRVSPLGTLLKTNRKTMRTLASPALLLLATLACQKPAIKPHAGPENGVIATCSAGEIHADEMEKRGLATLLMIRQSEYEQKTTLIEDIAFEKIITQRAAQAKLTPEAFLKREIDEKIPEPNQEQLIRARQDIRQMRHLPKDEAEAQKEIRLHYFQVTRMRMFRELQTQYLKEGKLEIALNPPRANTPLPERSPGRGPKDAAILLMEFSDFACPHSQKAQETLNALWKLYPDQIHHVWRAMPIDDKRPCQAALWAHHQGRYWPMRTLLFKLGGELSEESLFQKATELNLDATSLKSELKEGKETKQLDEDLAMASDLGLTTSPSFLINGRLIKGNPPLAHFAKILNEELRLKGQIPTDEQIKAQLDQ